MTLLKSFIFIISFSCIMTANDRNYCRLRSNSPYSFQSGVTSILITQNPLNGDDMINLDVTPALLSRSTLTNALSFPFTSATVGVVEASFCDGGGEMYSADIDGDGYDDLLCFEANLKFTHRLYVPLKKIYDDEKTLTEPAQFNCPAGSKIIIGNFDGNGPDEIMCIPSGSTDFSSTVIFSPPSCSKSSSNLKTMGYNPFAHGQFGKTRSFPVLGHHHGHNEYHDFKYHHGHRFARHSNNYACTTGRSYSFTSANVPSCNPTADDIVIGVVGVGTSEGLFCHLASDSSVNYYPGSTTLSSSMFGTAATINTFTPTCIFANDKLLAADVDGDGDSDLVCVHGIPTGTFKSDISFQTSPGVFDDFNDRSISCPEFCIDSSATASAVRPPLPFWYVLDFDGDGKDDVMCRYTTSVGTILQASISRPF